jgi:putative transcriptional regulator
LEVNIPKYVIEAVSKRIAGDIILSNEPGKYIRKWREIYGLGQVDVARLMGVSYSVISDYERGKRAAGRSFIRKFINALLTHDSKRGWAVTRKIARLLNIYVEGIIDIGEFREPLRLDEVVTMLEGIPLTSNIEHRPILGYTILDSVLTIQSITANEFVRVLGATSDRIVVFTNITRGRSVMVATRVSPVKPSVIVLHGIKKVDPLAIRIGDIEGIPIVQSLIDIPTMIERFRRKILI